MAGNSKLLIAEQNGTDLGYQCEYQLDCTDLVQKAGSTAYTIASDLLTDMVLYSNTSQITANRTASVTYTYNVEDQPTVEVWTLYDTTDGTSVLRTTTYTHTWVGDDITKTETS